ncbi:MAG: FAD-dependent oxidoreductase [Thermomicrobiales bacterium]|nr:FAD-dependent oxidoreductase [Thermomicrobiales bacterium]
MGHAADIPAGPDFSQGVAADDVPAEGMLAGRVGTEAVLLSRRDGRLSAVSGTCTHYGAPLAEGLALHGVVRCPWHHACFDLATGEALRAPAFTALDRWQVDEDRGRVFVRHKIDPAVVRGAVPHDLRRVLVVGGGAAGFGCAEMLRRRGYTGDLTILSADGDPPYDRPNLSKDFLAGSAPADWMPLKGDDFYAEQGIDLRLDTEAVAIDPKARTVTTASGESFAFDKLLLATGAEPIRPNLPGFDGPDMLLLRSFADARALAARAETGKRTAVLGSGFIGLEAAASLTKRGVTVTVVSLDHVPMQRQFGDEVGSLLRKIHEENGVVFRLGRKATRFEAGTLHLDDGSSVEADFVLLGLGVRPRTSLAAAAGLAVEEGVTVDQYLETSVAGIYAAGDIAAYPNPAGDGRRMRIEHWVVAERQGQTVARNMLGDRSPYAMQPFFWTEQHAATARYVGHAPASDVVLAGSVAERDFTACFFDDDRLDAVLTMGRDRQNLEAEAWLEGERTVPPPVCVQGNRG